MSRANAAREAQLRAAPKPSEEDEARNKAQFDASHAYSTAPEAGRKRAIDEKIMGGDYANGGKIDMNNEAYLKQLIKLASGYRQDVSDDADGLQFFMIKGGAEGFLDPSYKGEDASRIVVRSGSTTSGAAGTEMTFDDNDLLSVFDKNGDLVASALLRRPLSIKNPNIWSERTANKICDAWNGRPVSLYHNGNFDITYYGLKVDDSLGWYKSGRVRVDFHKEEATNGCIFIRDPSTPPLSDPAKLNAFEPRLIVEVQKSIGAKTKSHLGKMHVTGV